MEGSPIKLLPDFGAPTLQNLDPTGLAQGQRARGSNRQYVRFYPYKFVQLYTIEARVNEKTGESRPIKVGTREVEREMVHIITPGDKNEYNGEADEFHRREHWLQYKAYRDGNAAPIGTALDDCDFVPAPIATELKYRGCHTLEQLADASDLLCNQVASGWELREYARAYAKVAVENKSLEQVKTLRCELDKSQSLIKELQEQMKAVQAKPRGRPVGS